MLHLPNQINPITAASVVTSPWDDDELLMMVGHQDDEINAWIIDDDVDGNYTVEERFKGVDSFAARFLTSQVSILMGKGNEIWIADGDESMDYLLMLIEYVTIDKTVPPNSTLIIDGYDIKTTEEGDVLTVGLPAKSLVVSGGEFDPDAMYNVYGIQWDLTAMLIELALQSCL